MMIKKIVREEVALSINEVIAEITRPNKANAKKQVKNKKKFANNSVL